jgi:type I restriction enzyme, S subunit
MSDDQWMELESVCNVEYGTRVVQKRDGGSDYPVYGGGGATFYMDSFNREDRLVVARFGMSEECTRFVAGRFFLNDSGLTVSVKNGSMTQRFLDYQMLALNDKIYALGKGTAQKNLDVSAFRALPIYVPKTLPEQQRIVALLDEAFAGLATAKANAERNLQSARAVYESHVESIFSTRGEDWEEKRLEEVCGFQNGFAFKSSTFKPQGYPILRISNIQDGRIDAANRIVFFDPNDYREDLDRYRVSKGDLLIAMSGATTGKLGFNVEEKVYYLNQRVGKFEPTKRLDPRFLYYFLSTRVEENLRISAGSAQPNLSTEQIKGFLLPLPSIDEQTRIVDVLEALSKETQHLTQIYERKLTALEELKQSLLQQAFNGEL